MADISSYRKLMPAQMELYASWGTTQLLFIKEKKIFVNGARNTNYAYPLLLDLNATNCID